MSDEEQRCGAATVFWPDDEGCEAECGLTLGHEPHNIHEDGILGEWDDREMPTTHPNEPTEPTPPPETRVVERRYLDGPLAGRVDRQPVPYATRVVMSPAPGASLKDGPVLYGWDAAAGGYCVALRVGGETQLVRPGVQPGPAEVSPEEWARARRPVIAGSAATFTEVDDGDGS